MAKRKPMKPCPVKRAIRSIEECRDIHQQWADYFEGKPAEEKKRETRTQGEALGDRKWHRLWIRKYDHVIRVLMAALPPQRKGRAR